MTINICTATANLEQLSETMEKEFLALGEQLYQFRERSNVISQKAIAVGSQISGSDLKHVMEGLHDFHENISMLEGGSEHGVKALRAILDRFDEVAAPIRSLDKIVRFLDIICVIMKIENARLDELNTGFGTTAQSLNELGKVIRAKAEELDTQASTIGRSIRQSLQTIQENEQYKNSQSKLIIQRIVSSLEPLQTKRSASSNMLRNLSSRYQVISRNIGEIVSSLQFHDITRQRIEHCAEALEEIEPVVTGIENSMPVQDMEKAIAVGRIQAIQLNTTQEDLSLAVDRVIVSLQSLASSVKDITQEIKELLSTDRSGSSFFSSIEDNLAALKKGVNDYLQINRQIMDSMASVKDFSEEISLFANDIKNIGTGIRIVAINASVNAARIGSLGSGFGVLAQNTQDLATDTANQIEQVSRALRNITDLAQDLATINRASKNMENDHSEVLKNKLETIESLLRSTDLDVEDNLAELRNKSGSFEGDIAAAISSLHAPADFLDAISDIRQQLESFLHAARIKFPEAYAQTLAQDLDGLTQRYTMERERESHRLALSAANSKTETAGSSSVSRTGKNIMDSSPTLSIGDNVILF